MFCNNCGHQNPDGSKFCLGCGNNLQEAVDQAEKMVAKPAETKSAPAKKPSKVLLIIGIVLLAIGVITVFDTFVFKSTSLANIMAGIGNTEDFARLALLAAFVVSGVVLVAVYFLKKKK